MKYWSALFMLFFSFSIHAQKISGSVMEKEEGDEIVPLIGATVYWSGTTEGTVTNEQGKFKLKLLPETSLLVVGYVGYVNDTVDVKGKKEILVILNSVANLDEVEVIHKQKSTEISWMDPLKVEKISEKELLKAACCNLSESFDTSPSVDVSFTDAITGAREIQLLGLAGPYTQITRENMPDIRGLSSIYGLTYIPGTWVESIQLNKGTGTVVNGFESIAGQINVEMRKPSDENKVYLNLYGNQGGRVEANANFAKEINDKWSTAVLLHGKNNTVKNDRNNDRFLDQPLSTHLIALNRWKYEGKQGDHFQIGGKYTYIDQLGGQIDFQRDLGRGTTSSWGANMITKRIEGWAKRGKAYPDKLWKSYGIQFSGAYHEQSSYFGLNTYDGVQSTLYGNFIYQSRIRNDNNKFRTGVSFQYDDYLETVNNIIYDRIEAVPGAYFEYSYSKNTNFSLVTGLRMDYHNIFGLFFTPRLHMRYAFNENTVLRLSGGRGQRTASIFAENNRIFATSRQVIIQSADPDKPYGLDAEVAWNMGGSLTQDFRLDYRDGTISFDYYTTLFQNQIVIDFDQNPQTVLFYNLAGKSYSNSFQAQVDYEVVKRLDVRLAYRWFDVKTTYTGELLQKPLVSAHRAFINLAYHTKKYWKFDYTLNWQGNKRIPLTDTNPLPYQRAEKSPSFIVMNAQISKEWAEKFECYIGAENILNYTQSSPIIASDSPFGNYFDASLIWGPIFGRNIYGGVRYKIRK